MWEAEKEGVMGWGKKNEEVTGIEESESTKKSMARRRKSKRLRSVGGQGGRKGVEVG